MLKRGRRGLGLAPWHNRELLGEMDWCPRVDIGEADGTFLIKAEIPGVKKEDVKVSVQNGVLTLQGERTDEDSEQGLHFHRLNASMAASAAVSPCLPAWTPIR